MPMYEYICNECGRRFEQFTWSSSSDDEILCPACGAANARKVMSAFGVGRSPGTSPSACGPVG